MIRLHVTSSLAAGAPVAPTLDQSRYLTQVMRLKAGDALQVFNGRDGEWRAVVTEVLKKGVVLTSEEMVREQVTPPDVELLMAVIKKGAVEFAVEKATELGAARIRLITTARTQPQQVRLDRLNAIAEESAEQTGRMDVPAVDAPVKLDAVLDSWDGSRRLMFCDEQLSESSQVERGRGHRPRSTLKILDDFAPSNSSRVRPAWSILIGPEGGFSPDERERLRALPFATAVSLGPRVLRADTAAVTALTLWQAALGDWPR